MYICDMEVTKSKRGPKRSRYPFQLLKKIGDNIYIAGIDAKKGVYSSLRTYNKGISKPINITINAEGNGIRVWKISSRAKKKLLNK